MRNITCLLPAALLAPLLAQVGPVTPGIVVGTGHQEFDRYPRREPIAPGQILTLFLHGVGDNIKEFVKAPGTPLPTTLAGISVDLVYEKTTPVPIFLVWPFVDCGELPAYFLCLLTTSQAP